MKRRLSASIDEDLLAAAERAVRDGQAPSVSALVEDAIAHQLERTKRLRAMREFLDAYEEEFGAFEPGEVEARGASLMASARTAAEVLGGEPARDAA